ncbi:ricin-type beta-trefoil lectin domain protein [Parasphingorhabdus cellanae]|uniref:Ricin-type beta-trefoil lectin domain protein n=1 Tax=Parasphingorhabdus cellanae TaxID=2806553 RepID=A0ABX7SYW7_9SPHN|nr:ricin-type beta-trefoil lectin domain protein [Parasphingorhabdus cellanae]QTD54466.1 ricin-type beta-trefoil lectin domain protein [Parasphingorhabdus cellanae]
MMGTARTEPVKVISLSIGLSAAALALNVPIAAASASPSAARDTIAGTLGACGAEGQRSCTILERSDPCDPGLKLTKLIFGRCVVQEEARQEAERQYRPIRADAIADKTLLKFAIASYSLPHHDERELGGQQDFPSKFGCNRGDRENICTSSGIWEDDKIGDEHGRLEYFLTADNGMQAGLYHYAETDQFVLAFAGTDASKHADLTEDVKLATSQPVDRNLYTTLVKQVSARMKVLNRDARMDRQLTVTGHSLGGFQAQVFAAFCKVARFTTFSSPSAIGSIGATMKIPATSHTRGRHLYREGDSVADLVLGQYGTRIKYTATPYKLSTIGNRVSWFKEQHNKENFLKHLEKGGRPYGHVNFNGEKLRSKKVGGWPLRARYCVIGNLNPLNGRFKVGLCTSGVTFDFDRNGMFRNKRVNDAYQTCMQAGGNGARVFMAQCNGGPSQIWRHRGDQFINAKTGKCLDWSQRNKSHLITWNCTGSLNQKWEFYKPTLTQP